MKLLKITTFIATLVFIPSLVISLSLNRYFLIFEYSQPNFPKDYFGFSASDRLDLASQSLAFLTSWQSASTSQTKLAQITLPNSNSFLYTQDEISHLVDVKKYTDLIRLALIISITVLITIMSKTHLHPKKRKEWLVYTRAAALTLILSLMFIGGFAVIAWERFFLQFHQLLFPQGNWTFSLQSGLIRLFPQAFWVDYATLVISLILIIALGVVILTTLVIQRLVNVPSKSTKK